MRKRLIEKAKDGTLKANGEPKLIPKKRGRWDQTDDAPAQKKISGTSATPTSWDNADVFLLYYIYISKLLEFSQIYGNLI